MNIQQFVEQGGLFITIGGNASIPIDYGLIDGVSITPTRELQAPRQRAATPWWPTRSSPIAYGYGDKLAVYFNQAPVFQVSTHRRRWACAEAAMTRRRAPSGRGTATDPDVPQARPYTPPPAKPELKPGEEPPLTEEHARVISACSCRPDERPRVVLRFADEKDLLVSGMLAGGRELAGRPAVVDVPRGKGHYHAVRQQPDVAPADPGQLLPAVQRHAELRALGAWEASRFNEVGKWNVRLTGCARFLSWRR